MQQDAFIKLSQKESIFNIFSHLYEESMGRIILWQRIENSVHRICCLVKLKRLDINKEEFLFLPKQGSFNFSPQLPIYLWSKNKNCILKSRVIYYSPLQMVVKIPTQIMLENERKSERSNHASDERYIRYINGENHNRYLSYLPFKSKLLDLSDEGLAFKSNHTSVAKFIVGDTIRVENGVNEQHLIPAKVRYITTVIEPKSLQKYYRVGVVFT